MPMNPNFLCCIGAELKNSTQQTTRMSQVYLYRAFENDTLSDMLSAGFFNAAMGIIRQDDLLLLYSPNETTAKYAYARVSSVSSSGVVIERVGIEAANISVDTTGYSNLSGNNLQQIMNNLDALLTTIQGSFVKLDGTSIMTGPLKMRAGSMQGAVAAYWDGVGFFKLNSNDSVTLLASMEATDGLCPATNNAYNIGKTNYKWKDAHIARVITAVINNGYDIGVPATNGPDTLALKSEVDTAANSGRMITDQGVWFAKMYAATVPPAADDGTNYADFSQTDGDGNPIIVIYERQSGAWVQSQTVTPPANYDGYVPVTKKIWDIVEQTGQNGGRILWNHQSKEFTPYPNIVSFENIEVTGESTVDMPLNPVQQQIVNKDYVDNAIANSGSGRNIGDTFMTTRTDTSLAGAVECDGATYDTTDFTGDGSIGELLEAGKLDYVSLSAYSTAISTKGWCDKIGWDGIGNTVFRVPTLNAHIVQTNNIPVVGNGKTLGLTNGTNNVGIVSNGSWSQTGLLTEGAYNQPVGTTTIGTNPKSGNFGITTDQTKSGIIADTTDTAQLRVMIQIADGATDEALETCTQVLADVAALKYDYVVDFQAPTAQNNYTWYRKYKSGWVEQGGRGTTNSGNPKQIILPVAMADMYYNINILGQTSTDGYTNADWHLLSVSTATTPKTATEFYAQANLTGYNLFFYWEVRGMAAV